MTSLLNAIHLAYRGLEHSQQQIAVTSQNITNADREGYTRKTYRSDYITGNFGTAPIGGEILSALNPFLLEGVVNDTVDVGRKAAISEFLDVYARRVGNVVSDFSLSSTLNDFFTNLDILTSTPENRALKSQTVSDAEVIALYLRDMSSTIQGQRTALELEIDKSVDRINESLEIIHDLNEKMLRTSGQNSTTLTEYEDQRAHEVQKLAQEIDITFYVDGKNRMQIYHPSGAPMLLSSVRPLEFNPLATLASGISGSDILVNGAPLTDASVPSSRINGGRLSGLLELRDVILVEEQEKFDEYANVLRDTLNSVLNTGAARPPRNVLTGEPGFNLTDPFAGTGVVRIALTDNDGVVQSFTDFNLAGFADVNDLINGAGGLAASIAGVTTTLSPDGELIMDAIDPNLGISINEMTSDVGAGNQGFSDFFGLNDLFRSTDGATDIRVSDYLLANPDHLALGQLDNGAGLGVGDTGITVGDTRVIEGMSSSVDASVSFNAAGDFSAQNVSIRVYAESIMSRVALRASVAQDEVDAAEIIRQQGADFMNNVTGVNIDEETAFLLELESHYQASAQVISIVKDLLEELIAAVR